MATFRFDKWGEKSATQHSHFKNMGLKVGYETIQGCLEKLDRLPRKKQKQLN